MKHSDVNPSQWPHSSSKIKDQRRCGLDKAITLDMLASRAKIKHCKGGIIYPIIYTQVLKMSTPIGDLTTATVGQLL